MCRRLLLRIPSSRTLSGGARIKFADSATYAEDLLVGFAFNLFYAVIRQCDLPGLYELLQASFRISPLCRIWYFYESGSERIVDNSLRLTEACVQVHCSENRFQRVGKN